MSKDEERKKFVFPNLLCLNEFFFVLFDSITKNSLKYIKLIEKLFCFFVVVVLKMKYSHQFNSIFIR